jgi:Leucine-rich repeat (LRR) protein
LTSLNVSSNSIKGAEAGKALGNALAANTVLKQLDLSKNYSGAEFANEFAVGLRANGALEVLNISNNNMGELVLYEGWAKGEGWNENLRAYTWYKHTDGREQEEYPGGKPEGVTAIANAIPTMGAMMSLNISNNNLCAGGGKVLAEALKGNQVMTGLNISSNYLGRKKPWINDVQGNGPDMSGVIAISNAIPTMGALTSLDISNNKLARGKLLSEPSYVYFDERPWGSKDKHYESDMTGFIVIALADAIKNNGALVKLDISGNGIAHGDALQRLTEFCGTAGIELTS